MAILNPVTSDRKLRDFGVLDLEWIPSTRLPLPANATVSFDGMRGTCKIPLPVKQRKSQPLQVRIASFYDQPEVGEADDGEDPVREERFECFSTVRDLIDFLLTYENRARWFYAHAGGLADMEFVLDDLFKEIKAELDTRPNRVTVTIASEELRKQGVTKIEDYVKGQWKVRASFSGSSAIIIHVSKGKNAWHFIDSYWLFRDKLASIGKAIGITKGDTPEAVAWIRQRFGKNSLEELEQAPAEENGSTLIEAFYRDAPLDVLISYNRVDCEILWKAIAQFEQEIWALGGQLQQTIASTGMNLIRRQYLKRTIYTSDKINQIAEQTYFSSRVEVTSRNIEDGIGYDINSSFPFSMTFPLPGGLIEVRTSLPDRDSDDCIYLADVTMEVPDMPLPPLPYRVDGRVFFPIGRWRSWFTSTDIRLALKEGCTLHKVHEVYVFEPFNDLGDFVREIYGRRSATSDPFKKLLYKYLLNCPYGKFAETPFKQEMFINPDKIDREKLQLLQPGVWLAEKKATVAHRHVPISTIITALSRRHLYEFGKMCLEQGKPSAYYDSITGDRTVVLRDPDGRVEIDAVEEVWKRATPSRRKGEKETSVLPGWSALAKDSKGKVGWFPLTKLIRHKTSKELFLMSSKRGQVHVTGDHSLVVGGKEIKPSDFLAAKMQFETVPALPSGREGRTLDLWDFLKDFNGDKVTRGRQGEYTIKRRFELSGDGQSVVFANKGIQKRQSIKRFYEPGSEDLHALLRILAAYAAEGSASIKGVTTNTRNMFSLCQQDRGWLVKLKKDIKRLCPKTPLVGPKWSDGSNVYYLRSGADMLATVFHILGGSKSVNKKLPSFVHDLQEGDFLVFWRKIAEGDGTVDPAGRIQYTTGSQRLAAHLSYALDRHSMEHSIHYRPEKKAYMIRTRPEGSERNRSLMNVERSFGDGFVYDLQVEGAHTFVDGVGRVLLHNTDSLWTKADLPVDDSKLGCLKLEKRIKWAEFLAPKIYRGEGFELQKDGQWKPMMFTKAKGFSLGRSRGEAWRRFDQIAGGDRIGIQRQVRMRELYRSGDTSPIDILVIKALTFEMLSKRFHYPDGETRPWHIKELVSGDVYPKGFNFEDEILERIDTTTRAMMDAVV